MITFRLFDENKVLYAETDVDISAGNSETQIEFPPHRGEPVLLSYWQRIFDESFSWRIRRTNNMVYSIPGGMEIRQGMKPSITFKHEEE